MPWIVFAQSNGRVESINRGFVPTPGPGMAVVHRDEEDIDVRRERLDPAFPDGPLFDLPLLADVQEIDGEVSVVGDEVVLTDMLPPGTVVLLQAPDGSMSSGIAQAGVPLMFTLSIAGDWVAKFDHNDYATFTATIHVNEP